MNTSVKNCIAVLSASILTALVVFLLSMMNVLNLEVSTSLLPGLMTVSLVLYAVFFYTLIVTEKNRLVRDAVCCCGKLAIIGFAGLLTTAPMALLLYGTSVRILFDLVLGLVFFFLVLSLSGTGCVVTVIYHCRRNEC